MSNPKNLDFVQKQSKLTYTYSDSDVMLPLCVSTLTAMRSRGDRVFLPFSCCRGDRGEDGSSLEEREEEGKLSTRSGGTRTSRLPAANDN